MIKRSPFEISILLGRMGIDTRTLTVGENGWATIKSPFRDEKKPSFGIHPGTGNWIDHTTGEKGNLIELYKLRHGYDDWRDAAAKIQEILGQYGYNQQYSGSQPTFSIRQSTTGASVPTPTPSFWDDSQQKQLREDAHQRLLDEPNHEFVTTAQTYDGISYDTLKVFGCGIYSYRGADYLLLPYESGGQLYRRDEDNEKQIRSLPGSSTKGCFFGQDRVQGTRNLHLTKSPREAMLLSQQTSDDVIGLCSGEDPDLSESQQEWLSQHLPKQIRRIFVYLDCDTEDAKNTAWRHAFAVQQACSSNVKVYVTSVYAASKGTAKDLADWIRGGRSFSELHPFSEKLPPVVKFWEKLKGGGIRLSHHKLIQMCEAEGFVKIYVGNEAVLVWNQNNVLRHTTQSKLIDFIRTRIDSTPDTFLRSKDPEELKGKILEAFFKQANTLTGPTGQQLFSPTNIQFATDTKDQVFLFFKNGMVEVTKDTVNLQSYEDLEGTIWQDQIIDHSIALDTNQASASEFADFVDKLSGGKEERRKALKSTLGYLCSTYKDPANAKAIVFVDEVITSDDEAEGGTGKSLFASALKYVRKFRYIPGKNHSPTHRFAFQSVELGDQVLFIDDVQTNYYFEGLFNVITNDMHIEQKGQNIIKIPFKLSPKIVIATNTSIGGSGNSFERRQSIVEFPDYFHGKHTPVDEYGHRLFDDWEQDEWNRFYNFIIQCIQEFLANGLSSYTDNYKLKKLINETSEELVEYYRSEIILDHQYDKKQLFRQFKREFPDPGEHMSQGAFTKQIKKCGELDKRVYKVVEKKYGAERTITFWTEKRYRKMINAKNKGPKGDDEDKKE